MVTADTLGINCVEAILFDTATLDRVFSDIAAFGFKHVRCEIPWSIIEPAKGQPKWSLVAQLKAAADNYGLTILPAVGIHNPSWAWTPADFTNFCSVLAGNLRLPAYELGNEPNLHLFCPWAAVAGPVAIAQAGAKGIRAQQPDALLLSPGLASSITFTGYLIPWFKLFALYTNKSPEDWLREAIAQPGGLPFDIAAYHPYAIDSGFAPVAPTKSPFLTGSTDALRKVLREAKRPADDLWLTEWGFDTATISPADVLARFKSQWELTPKMQGPNGRSYLFCWRDYDGHGGKYGLVNSQHVPRQPLYDHVKALLKT